MGQGQQVGARQRAQGGHHLVGQEGTAAQHHAAALDQVAQRSVVGDPEGRRHQPLEGQARHRIAARIRGQQQADPPLGIDRPAALAHHQLAALHAQRLRWRGSHLECQGHGGQPTFLHAVQQRKTPQHGIVIQLRADDAHGTYLQRRAEGLQKRGIGQIHGGPALTRIAEAGRPGQGIQQVIRHGQGLLHAPHGGRRQDHIVPLCQHPPQLLVVGPGLGQQDVNRHLARTQFAQVGNRHGIHVMRVGPAAQLGPQGHERGIVDVDHQHLLVTRRLGHQLQAGIVEQVVQPLAQRAVIQQHRHRQGQRRNPGQSKAGAHRNGLGGQGHPLASVGGCTCPPRRLPVSSRLGLAWVPALALSVAIF